MENQTIREELFDVLFSYVKEYDGIYTESDCAAVRDEICLRIDQSQLTADEAEERINQEVEKRIAERMPSEEEIDSAAYHYGQFPDLDGVMIHDGEAQVTFAEGAEWLRSRLTCSEKPNNSPTEQTPQVTPQVPLKTEGGKG